MKNENNYVKSKENEKKYFTSSNTKKIFGYIVKGEKSKYIWNYSVLMRGLMIVGIISLFVVLVFGELYNYTAYFLLHTAIKLALCIPVAAYSGKLTYEVFEDIRNRGCWTKATVWKYILGEGVFGYGLICFITIGQFLPFNVVYIIAQSLIWAGIGMIIGIWTRVSWKIEKIKSIFVELKEEGIC